MIDQVLGYLKNFFIDTYEYGTYTIASNVVTGTFAEEYVAGQYISIDGTKVNDGVYLISEVGTNTLTLDNGVTLTDESPSDNIFIFGLAVPRTVKDLVTEINTYNTNSTYGVSSETQGARSITYSDGGSTWQNAFKAKLRPYRRIYSDKEGFYQMPNLYTKGY